MKKFKSTILFSIIMMALIIIPINVKAQIASGESGTCKWSISDGGALLIEPKQGSDCQLDSYTANTSADNVKYGDVAWAPYRSQIKSVSMSGTVKGATGAKGLFYNIKANGNKIDLSHFDTSEVKNMRGMLEYAEADEFDLSGINTASVTNMERLFQGAVMKKITLGKNFNFKIGEAGVSSGAFGRGTWKSSINNKLYSVPEIVSMTRTTTETYTKVSNISNALDIDYALTYKVGKITGSTPVTLVSGSSNVFLQEGNDILAKVNFPASTSNYTINDEVVFKLVDIVSDENGTKYDLEFKIKNIKIYDLASSDGGEQGVVTLYVNGNFSAFLYKSLAVFRQGYLNRTPGLLKTLEEDVTLRVLKKDGSVASGNYLFSVYDLDIPSVKDSEYITSAGQGYGTYSEGITFVSGFEASTIRRSEPSLLYNPSGNRWTGTATDQDSELSEIAVRVNANGFNFVWTGPTTAETELFNNYQPKSVEITKTDANGVGIKGAKFEIYRGSTRVKTIDMTNATSATVWLAPGEYTLKETQAPTGYTAAADIVFFVDTNDTLTVNGQTVDKVVVKNTVATYTYKVNYIYDDGSATGVLLDPKNVGGSAELGAEIGWAQFKIDIDGYIYDNRDERNITIQADVSKNVINLYYIKKGTVIAKYVDKETGAEIATREISEDRLGERYETEQKEIDNYTFVEDTGNTTGEYAEETIEVIYYYTKVVPVPNTGLHATYQIIAGIALIAISLFGIKSRKKQHR